MHICLTGKVVGPWGFTNAHIFTKGLATVKKPHEVGSKRVPYLYIPTASITTAVKV